MEPNPTAAVNPNQANIDLLAEWPDDSPIAMLNLLAYDGDEGRAAYARYAAVAGKTVAARGGSAIFMGPVIESTDQWDTVIVVYYPRRAAYLDMQLDPAYRGVIPERTQGLKARLLYPFALPASDTGQPVSGSIDEVFVLELVRWSDPANPSETVAAGHLELDLPAGGPGMVSDGRWDQLRLVRYASVEESQTSESPNPGAAGGVEDTLRLVAQAGVPA